MTYNLERMEYHLSRWGIWSFVTALTCKVVVVFNLGLNLFHLVFFILLPCYQSSLCCILTFITTNEHVRKVGLDVSELGQGRVKVPITTVVRAVP